MTTVVELEPGDVFLFYGSNGKLQRTPHVYCGPRDATGTLLALCLPARGKAFVGNARPEHRVLRIDNVGREARIKAHHTVVYQRKHSVEKITNE